MLTWKDRAPYLVALVLCFVAALGGVIWDSSQHQQKQPPREQNGQSYKEKADQRPERPAAVQINCDPNCTAGEPDQGRHYVSQFLEKLLNDPLSIVTLLLVFAVMVQIRDGRRSSERQLRAYVVIKSVEFSRPNTKDGDQQHWPIHIVYRNAGQTPAYNVAIKAESALGAQRPINEMFVLSESVEVAPQSIIAPDARHIMRLGGLEPGRQQFLKAQAAEMYCYVWGRLDYIDTFGRKHFTKFQLWHGFYTAVLQFGFCQVGNETDDEFPEPWWRKLNRRKSEGSGSHSQGKETA